MALPKDFLAGIPHLALERYISGENEGEDVLIVNLAGILVQCGYGAWDNTVIVELLKRAEDNDNDSSIREVTQRMEDRCRMLGLRGSDKQESIGNDKSESNVLDVGEAGDEECKGGGRKNSDGMTSAESLESLPSPERCRGLLHQLIKHSTPLGSISSSLPSFPSLPSSLPSLHTSLSSSG